MEAFVIGGGVAGFLPAEEEMLKRVQHDSLILVRMTIWCGGAPNLLSLEGRGGTRKQGENRGFRCGSG